MCQAEGHTKANCHVFQRFVTKHIGKVHKFIKSMKEFEYILEEHKQESLQWMTKKYKSKVISDSDVQEDSELFGWRELAYLSQKIHQKSTESMDDMKEHAQSHNQMLQNNAVCCVCSIRITVDSHYQPLPCFSEHYLCNGCRYQNEETNAEFYKDGVLHKIPHTLLRCPICMTYMVKTKAKPAILELASKSKLLTDTEKFLLNPVSEVPHLPEHQIQYIQDESSSGSINEHSSEYEIFELFDQI